MIKWREIGDGTCSGVGPLTDLIFTIKRGPDAETNYLSVMKAGSLPSCVGAYTWQVAMHEAELIDGGSHGRVKFDANAPSGIVFAPEYGSTQDAQMAHGGRLYF